MSGYYEWKKEGSSKVPYYIEPEAEDGLALAALWDRWQGPDGPLESCTIVTAPAPDSMKWLHSRIPIHFTLDQTGQWVDDASDAEALATLLAPKVNVPLTVTAMSTYVSNARNKGERCIEPQGETRLIGCN